MGPLTSRPAPRADHALALVTVAFLLSAAAMTSCGGEKTNAGSHEKMIVLGFDGSPGSRIAARIAVTLANGLNEAVHVFVDSKDKGRAVARFDEVRQLVGGLSVPVRETSSTLGRPDVKIVDTAKEARGGLIVIGAYGRNRITDFFLGSNAAAVVNNFVLEAGLRARSGLRS